MPVPWNVGVLSLVRLSELEEPLSLKAARSGTDGTPGAPVSIVQVSMLVDGESFPAASVAMIESGCGPSASTIVVTL